MAVTARRIPGLPRPDSRALTPGFSADPVPSIFSPFSAQNLREHAKLPSNPAGIPRESRPPCLLDLYLSEPRTRSLLLLLLPHPILSLSLQIRRISPAAAAGREALRRL